MNNPYVNMKECEWKENVYIDGDNRLQPLHDAHIMFSLIQCPLKKKSEVKENFSIFGQIGKNTHTCHEKKPGTFGLFHRWRCTVAWIIDQLEA